MGICCTNATSCFGEISIIIIALDYIQLQCLFSIIAASF